jgi:hypothetical protein
MPRKPAEAKDPALAIFKNFVYLVWEHLQLPDPTPAQYAICDRLQYGPKRMIIQAFRGIGKSWICSAFVIWSIVNNINLKFLIVSASKARADDFSIFCQRLISEIPMLQHLIPDEEQRSSRIAFDVAGARAAHAPTVKSVGISGQITGSRADIVIADDCEVVSNSATEDQRDKLLKAVLEFEAVLSPGGRIIYLGTPQCEMSLYNKLRGKGYEAYIWPARYPTAAKLETYGGGLAPEITEALAKDPTLTGAPTDPRRFSEQELIEREGAYGRSGFALQFMLDSTLSDSERYPLKTADLVVLDVSEDKAPISIAWASGPGQLIRDLANIGFSGDRFYRPLFADEKWTLFEGSVMAIDPSGRGKDETGYACVKQLHGNLFITASGGLIGGYSGDTLIRLATIAKENKVGKIIIEENFGDGMYASIFTPVLASIYPCTIEEIRHNTQKERRIIDTLEPLLNKHRLIVTSDVVKEDLRSVEEERTNCSLFYQLTHITKDRGSLKVDDRLDALAMACAYWVTAVRQDEDSSAKAARDSALDLELEKFMRHALGAKPQNKTWLHSGPRQLLGRQSPLRGRRV